MIASELIDAYDKFLGDIKVNGIPVTGDSKPGDVFEYASFFLRTLYIERKKKGFRKPDTVPIVMKR